MAAGGKRAPLAPILLVVVLVWAVVAGYFLSSTQSAVDRTAQVVPKIASSLNEIDVNTKATSQVTKLKNLNQDVLKQVKPLQPILEQLNTDTGKVESETDKILATTRSAQKEAAKTQRLVGQVNSEAATTGDVVDSIYSRTKGVQNAVEGAIAPGRSTLRNVLETEPSIGSVNLQVDAIVKDLGVVGGFVVKAIEKAAVGRIEKACANPKNKVKCAVGKKVICARDKSLPFCKKGAELGDRTGAALAAGAPR